MFEGLAVFKPGAAGARPAAVGGLISGGLHAGLLYFAVIATQKPPAAPLRDRMVTDIEFPSTTPPDRGPAAPAAIQPFRVTVPVVIPTDIPPIDSSIVVDTVVVPRVGFGLGPVMSRDVPDSVGAPVYADLVDVPPEILSMPALEYPPLLRQAGIEGRVLIEAVVDTAGRVEAGSLRVVTSTANAFEASALDLVARSVYHPGRIRGWPVRVTVHVPIEFAIAHE